VNSVSSAKVLKTDSGFFELASVGFVWKKVEKSPLVVSSFFGMQHA
jgi:hypothetical protein